MNLHAILPEPVIQDAPPEFPVYLLPLKNAPEELSPFFSGLAHEIRNPLSNIKLATEMLLSMITDINQRSYLDIVLRGSDKINLIVTDLLHSSYEHEIRMAKHSVMQLIDEILADTADRVRLKNITVSRKYSAIDDNIEMHRPKIKIALTNIIINAIEAMPEGSGELKLVTKITGDKYCVEIGDNGCGISIANLKNIFRPYYSDKAGGLGIGLAATYDILKSENVTIDVESEKEIGTRFILLFDRIPSP
ncbi:MAG TPA: ATP-binding protein [Chitinophagaceae bacterium]|jgi:signal transduction histidine kinase|nr:ATP-binding protein [Chitinophagaceae bacterium]